MLAEDKKKIANVIYSQRLKEKKVNDLEYSARPGIEACAREIIAAVKEDDAGSLASAIESLLEIASQKADYSTKNKITIES